MAPSPAELPAVVELEGITRLDEVDRVFDVAVDVATEGARSLGLGRWRVGTRIISWVSNVRASMRCTREVC